MRIVGVVSAHAPAYARSLEAGHPVDAPVSTRLADGMACRVAEPTALALMRGAIDGIVEVDDDAIAQAMKALYMDTHNVAEGAGAASLAAAMRWAHERPDEIAGRCVGLTLCGANVDHDVFAEVLRDTSID